MIQPIKFQNGLSDVLSKLRLAESTADGDKFDRYWE